MSQVVLQLEQQDSNQNREMNEMASAYDDARPSTSNDGTNIYMQNTALPPNKQIHTKVVNDEFTSGRKHGRTSTRNNPSRLSPWDTFWNRVKPSKKNELALSDTTKMEARKEEEFGEADITLTSFLDKVKLGEFDGDIIAAACNQFSSSNKVGQGGFGSVYKVGLISNDAVKRLSESSYMGINEFYNEILLLPKLQHPNIIELLGHCCHRRDKLLVYEFMVNMSLDTFRDKEKGSLLWLLWPVRFKIITGIARGLKLSNILLDNKMIPKISHFAGARSLVEHQSENEIYCNILPECPRREGFSVKPELYNFGIIVLEILTCTRASNPEYLGHMMTLRNFAQNLWNEGKALDLVDDSLGVFSADEALRCIEAALLCTQWDSDQRPDMPSVLKLLNGGELPQQSQEPRHQAFS